MEIDSIKEKLKNIKYDSNEVKYKKFEKLGIILNQSNEGQKSNNYVCSVCKKCLISSHCLSIHCIENHDTFFNLTSAKKPSFVCFLEECKSIVFNKQERKDHCIKDHKFPVDFPDF
ncbi:hypothetical protein PVAND_003858 [Polypedilum vanderplanki]|uniref:C2H2-type domain-containing protein n=1 Tax=Polypedilum vanderplanki TaxID=319348 RepID=A0A9J6BVB5_POLVA|nr:hypothetical protein PVAND_003858 [Polypedilum vanderplanki]